MDKEIKKIFRYFSFFSYLPNFKEIHTFYPKKISKKDLKKILLTLEDQKKIIFDKEIKRYTVGEYSIKLEKIKKNLIKRQKISEKKLSNFRFSFYLKLLSLFPQIKLVGLSGSLSMMNAKKNDDIDLFIISLKNRLFTARFIAIFFASILGIRRKRTDNKKLFFTDKVCLNLFFDEKDLEVPDVKKNEYVAHEVLQMRPILNKENIYQSFLKKNSWVFGFFPNAKVYFKIKDRSNYSKKRKDGFFYFVFSLIGDIFEFFFKKLELFVISHHQTTEIITSFQLWFHPDDFEKKILI